MSSIPNFLSLTLLVVSPVYIVLSLVALSSRFVSLLGIMASHGKTHKKTTNSWSIHVPKGYFTHFYFWGLVSAVTFFYTVGDLTLSNISWAELLLLVHLLRRLCECLYVHRFRPESHMNLAGYLLGIGHYLVLPLAFVRRKARPDFTVLAFACCLWNLWMQYEQNVHHRILAELRKRKRPINSCLAPEAYYGLPPNKRWFRWFWCPHYVAEILIYASWAILLAQQESLPWTEPAWLICGSRIRSLSPPPSSSSSSWCHNLLLLLQRAAARRHWFLLLWVATNLTVSALNNRDWYTARYPARLSKSA